MLFINFSCSNDDVKVTNNDDALSPRKFKASYGIISPERAQELNNNWSAIHANAIEAAIGKPDNRSVKFSLQDIRAYLDYTENQAQDLGYDMDGVRIYIALW
ncbi:hypothetical protein BZARG_338 [Bizionia argentinensis JUB59]|uniref:Uncharacterized protein n=1 Tax=Bizionia argentinensis JUB59 TaxID=1046627 RepID=G2E9X7_9FLAO|nr:hypothetical protein [Bizionia argentinensis]EGV44734.1 hypothetical protein BZARG_338 [Bizionia argentinensis JUB59]